MIDPLLTAADSALRTLFATPRSARPTPQPAPLALQACPTTGSTAGSRPLPGSPAALPLSPAEKKLSAALMRVNHVGEVCAQALYTAQALATRESALREHFERASLEETDHLAWTQKRLAELGARPSLLNPLWYAGAFGLGLLAGRLGDAVSLGFVVETENQVEAHLASHLEQLPQADHASRAIVAQMMLDEAQHALTAQNAGAMELPAPVKSLMKAAARVMTTTAHYI